MYINFPRVRRFQEGGAVPPQEAQGGAPAGGGDPMQEILQAAAQAVQNNDGQLALQVCQALVQLAQGGGGAPEGGAPAPAEGGEEPVYRLGGRLAYRQRY